MQSRVSIKSRSKSTPRFLAAGESPAGDGTQFHFWPLLLCYAVALSVVCVIYSLITGHIWEDALITLRSAENLVNGHGLTYHVGTRVHTFTSPINVLMLALCYLLTGKGTYVATLWAYRVFSIAAYAGSGVLILSAAARAVPRWSLALWWLALVYLFDSKSVVFSTNGMETAYMLLFVAWAVYLISPPQPDKWLARGLCWAGLMWSRPDGCVYIAALAAAELLFSGIDRKLLLRSYARSAVVGAIVYGPWFFWAWSYYGSPVPNTILAKRNPMGIFAQLWDMMDSFPDCVVTKASLVFRHVYSEFGPLIESAAVQGIGNVTTSALAIFCLIYWILPVDDRYGKLTSFSFAIVCTYFGFQGPIYPWYFPPAAMLGFITLASAVATCAARIQVKNRPFGKTTLVAGMALFAVIQFFTLAFTTWEMKIQQSEIEDGTRKQVGLWLREHSKTGDRVYLEPLGYIGYFSGLTMHDYPGLASPIIVNLRREKHLELLTLIPHVRADWVVLRPHEFRSLIRSDDGRTFQSEYELVQQFDAFPRLEQYGFIPGVGYVFNDAAFGVFHRKSAENTP
jgi:hypothetical protein